VPNQWANFWLKFFLETRLSSESLEPLIGFLAYLEPKSWIKKQKLVKNCTLTNATVRRKAPRAIDGNNSLSEWARELFKPSKDSLLIKGAVVKGASSWLSALPIKAIGYALNKQEFTDAICMRYGWKVKGIPNHCACGKTNSVDHSLICKLGGYTSMRHNSVRDSEAQIMREVCRDVQTEPTLLPINGYDYQRKVNTADNARLDISAWGLWNSCKKTFFDIRITYPTSQSYSGKSLAEVYQQHEKEKDKYNQKVIDMEKSSFNPLVFTTTGGMAPECNRVNKRLAEKIAAKRRESYASVITFIRTKLRFVLLRSTLAAIRGFRGKRSDVHLQDLTGMTSA